MIRRIRQRRAHSPGRRILDYFRSRLLGAIGKGQRVYFVTIGGHRYKRVVFGDSHQAATVAGALEAMIVADGHEPPPAPHFPELLVHLEREVWTRFVEGRRPDAGNHVDRELLAKFFAAVYRHRCRNISTAESPLPARLTSDLRFLADSGVLTRRRADELAIAGRESRPQTLLLGYDYVDPVLKNFLVTPDGIVAIDIESLQAGRALGTGIAKCRVHWLEEPASEFAGRVVAAGAPDFRDQLPFVELCFLAGWTKRKILTGKGHRADPARFDSF